MEQVRREGPQGDEPQQEGEEAAQSPLQAVVQGTAISSKQTVQWLSNLSAAVQTVRSMVAAMVPSVRAVVSALKEGLTVALRFVMRVLAAVAEQLGALLRPMLLQAVHQLVQPLLQAVAERGVAAVLKTLESSLQEHKQAQPAPAGAPEAAAR
jgi:hypothetical protein